MKLLQHLRTGLACVALIALSACGGGGDPGGGIADSGTLRVAMTDAPACGYDSVNVTVQKVRVHQSSSAADGDAGWSEIVLNPARRLDLLSLTNGVLSELGQTPLAAGKYTQLRLVLADNAATAPWANSVVPAGGAEVPLKTPSGQQSGVKTNIDIDIAANKMADLVLDFNACRSVVRAGASGNYLLNPVVTVIPRFISGVSGYVASSLANGATTVSLQQGGAIVKATVPDSTGRFLLRPVAAGTYTLVVTAPGDATVIVTSVVVTTDTVTAVNLPSAPVNSAASASGTVAGTVTVTPAPSSIDAAVRVLQPLTGGGTVEIVGGPVDGATGKYVHALAVAAPLVASYVAGPGLLTFSADGGAAGKYVLEARSGGVVKTAGPVTITSGATVTTNFAFP